MPYHFNALSVPVTTTAVRPLCADECEQAFAGRVWSYQGGTVYPMALGLAWLQLIVNTKDDEAFLKALLWGAVTAVPVQSGQSRAVILSGQGVKIRHDRIQNT